MAIEDEMYKLIEEEINAIIETGKEKVVVDKEESCATSHKPKH